MTKSFIYTPGFDNSNAKLHSEKECIEYSIRYATETYPDGDFPLDLILEFRVDDTCEHILISPWYDKEKKEYYVIEEQISSIWM